MNEIIDLNQILEEFINPIKEPIIQKVFKTKEQKRIDLLKRAKKSLIIKDGLKTEFWREIQRPKLYNTLKSKIGTLLRPSSLNMTEIEIKTVLAELHAQLSTIADMKYLVDDGDRASVELERMR